MEQWRQKDWWLFLINIFKVEKLWEMKHLDQSNLGSQLHLRLEDRSDHTRSCDQTNAAGSIKLEEKQENSWDVKKELAETKYLLVQYLSWDNFRLTRSYSLVSLLILKLMLPATGVTSSSLSKDINRQQHGALTSLEFSFSLQMSCIYAVNLSSEIKSLQWM